MDHNRVTDSTEPTAAPPLRRWDRIDAWMARASEYLNPILVKETRQALKSRQFLVMFALLLLCGWVWSLFVLAWAPGIYYGAGGMDIFMGYFFILCFPLIVVVPFSAYRSLASEWEDGTYDLMSISTLNARQIVTGKLGSAVLQMIVYLSAIAPCLAFTYLLRGIDVVTIGYLLFWLCMNCLLATFLALAVATITRSKAWQVLVSVVLIALFLFNYVMVFPFMYEVVDRNELRFDDRYLWIASGAILTVVLGYSLMFLFIARARLMFPTENRSSALRVIMLLQYAAFAAWWGWAWWYEWDCHPVPVAIFMILSAIHWYVMGMFMTGEGAELSPRVKRDLPQSFLGRSFLTWFNPGSGTGYLFAVSSFAAAVVLGIGTMEAVRYWWPSVMQRRFTSPWLQRDLRGAENIAAFLVSYLIIYLGAGRLLISWLRRRFEVNMFSGVLLHLGLFAVGNLAPVFLHLALFQEIDDDHYSVLQLPCVVWTLVESVEHPDGMALSIMHLLLPIVAVVVLACNLPGVAREVQQFRMAKPQRVEEDDAALHPPPPPRPTSPWD
jgi:hypothetical protein